MLHVPPCGHGDAFAEVCQRRAHDRLVREPGEAHPFHVHVQTSKLERRDDVAAKTAGTAELAAQMPFNANKPSEYDPGAAMRRRSRATR